MYLSFQLSVLHVSRATVYSENCTRRTLDSKFNRARRIIIITRITPGAISPFCAARTGEGAGGGCNYLSTRAVRAERPNTCAMYLLITRALRFHHMSRTDWIIFDTPVDRVVYSVCYTLAPQARYHLASRYNMVASNVLSRRYFCIMLQVLLNLAVHVVEHL